MSVSSFFEPLQHALELLGLEVDTLAVIALSIAWVCAAYFKYRGADYVRSQNELTIELRKLKLAERLLLERPTQAESANTKPLPLKSAKRAPAESQNLDEAA